MDIKTVAVVPKRGIVCKMAGGVANHSRAAAAAIVVLTILVIGMFVYYHGISRFGPYAKKSAMRGKKSKADDGEKSGEPDETDKLIKSINGE